MRNRSVNNGIVQTLTKAAALTTRINYALQGKGEFPKRQELFYLVIPRRLLQLDCQLRESLTTKLC